MTPVQLLLVGGFLGAGKTTLLRQAARRLAGAGRRVGLITNDQAPDLVDTGLLAQQGMSVEEVAGSCFCCNFNGLIEAAGKLRQDVQADVLIAEPVGSCTDLSATILQPLKDKFSQEFVLAPLSVLADPVRLKEVLSGQPGRLHESAAYILCKQLEEADVIVLNKTDLLSTAELHDLRAVVAGKFPDTEIRGLSALTGEGVDEWLSAVLADRRAGRKVIDVDYDTYAEGEAVLGWLNATATLEADEGVEWDRFCRDLLGRLSEDLSRRSAEIAHLKVLLSSPSGLVMANITKSGLPPTVQGTMERSSRSVRIILNVRAETTPEILRKLVENRLADLPGKGTVATVERMNCFSPGRPRPTHRYTRVIRS